MINQESGAIVSASGNFMGFAREAYFKCIEAGNSDGVYKTKDNKFSFHALSVYIMTATALESFINEICFRLSPRRVDVSVDGLDNLEITLKYYLLPKVLWGKTFDRGALPYQDFNILINLRNGIVHYKIKDMRGTKYFKYLKRKNLLMSPNRNVSSFDQLCNTKTARWAYNTTCKTAHKLIEFSDDNTKKLTKYLLYNFRELT